MALILPNSIFLHIPKTGGEWVREAIEQAGIPNRESNRGEGWNKQKHSVLTKTTGRGRWCFAFRRKPWTWYRRHPRFTFAFVRDPLTWYQSRWAYRMRLGWKGDIDRIDRVVQSDDFGEFIRKYTEHFPGHLTLLYERYVGPEDGWVSFVGKHENLTDDLVKALTMAGEKFDEEKLRATPMTNVSSKGDNYKSLCQYTPELEKLVIASEEKAMRRFGYLK